MLEVWALAAAPITPLYATTISFARLPIFRSNLQSCTMLRALRLHSQRRLLRRADIRHDLRIYKQMEAMRCPAESYEPSVSQQELPRMETLSRGATSSGLKDRKAVGLQAFRSYFPATHASLVDPPFRRFRKEQDPLARRTRVRSSNLSSKRRVFNDAGPVLHARDLSYYSAEQFSDEESANFEEDTSTPYFVDLEGWRWRLHRFAKNEREHEIVTKDKKDRRDYEHIQVIVKQLGLHSQMYGKVVVISKTPLPNYRPDLDDRRPQRQVSFPSPVQKNVDSTLKEYAFHKKRQLEAGGGLQQKEFLTDPLFDTEARDELDRVLQFKNEDRMAEEELLVRRNRQLRNKQRSWRESSEGEKMLAFRKTLPSYKERDALLAAISRNQVLVLSGETGCGKTTQLPQYVLESEIDAGRGATCNIICTQPRRISAVSVAERVAAERGEEIGESVGYKVRLEGMRSRKTQLLFCTTGILLRRLMSDPELKGVSHVVVDEIHERGMNEDFLLVVLKDLLPHRPDLRLILMSATLNAELFSSFFKNAPMIHIPGFTYPVKSHFLEEVLEITGHRLTASNQIDDYGQEKIWKTKKQYVSSRKKNQLNSLVEDAMADHDFSEYTSRTRDSLACWNPDNIGFNMIERVLCHIVRQDLEGAVLVFMTGWEDISALMEQLQGHPLLGNTQQVQLLACHGSMQTAEQKLIFGHPPLGIRKIVLATNMAETSITINDVVFVVDCGKAKETSYDALNNTPCLLPSWISKASARQRRGRAGRVKPGVCYHLYPKAVYDAFAEYQQPELLRTPLHSLCLQIKSLKLGSIGQFLSRALQPPEPLAVQNAVELLKTIGALDDREELTHLGQHLSLLPVEPKIGKMLIMGSVFGCLDPVLTIAAGLAVRDPFVTPMDKKELAEQARSSYAGNDSSDHIALVRAYEGWQAAMTRGNAFDYCWRNFLSFQTLQGMNSLRRQFASLLTDAGFLGSDTDQVNAYSGDRDLVRGVICAGMFPGVVSVYQRTRSTTFKTIEDGQVLLNQNSVNAKDSQLSYPWLVFNEKVKTNSVMIRDSTGVSDSMLLLFGGQLSPGGQPGHLVMHNGYLEFFMQPEVASMYLRLRNELDELLTKKLENPEVDIFDDGRLLMKAVFDVLEADRCEGSFTFGRKVKNQPPMPKPMDVTDVKGLLQTLMMRAGKKAPQYRTRMVKGHQYQSSVEVKGKLFTGDPAPSKKQAEKNASSLALEYLTGLSMTKKERMAKDRDSLRF